MFSPRLKIRARSAFLITIGFGEHFVLTETFQYLQ